VVFRRRIPLSWAQSFWQAVYPKGGWLRALRYVVHRVRRLPDPAHKIARGVAAGVFVSFTPLFGLHFVLAAALAWLLGGNIVAAILATFVGNPVTFPLIAAVSMEMGGFLLGKGHVPLPEAIGSFSQAAMEIWQNVGALFTENRVSWRNMEFFFDEVFLPYLVGAIFPGFVVAMVFYWVTTPVITAYQRARVARLKKRFAKKREKVISRRLEMPK
jgi:uncharacterized protein (DUF2062 family)